MDEVTPESNYRKALQDARREREELKKKAIEIEVRLNHLEQTISALAVVCGESINGSVGFTDAIRQVLKAAQPAGLYASAVKEMLETCGFSLKDYSNPMASIHTILKRLSEGGEARTRTDKDGRTSYFWSEKGQKVKTKNEAEDHSSREGAEAEGNGPRG